jgi:hypothetical protein
VSDPPGGTGTDVGDATGLPEAPANTPLHVQVGATVYVMAIVPPAGTTTLAGVVVATVTPLTAITVVVPPVRATSTGKLFVFVAVTVLAGTGGATTLGCGDGVDTIV